MNPFATGNPLNSTETHPTQTEAHPTQDEWERQWRSYAEAVAAHPPEPSGIAIPEERPTGARTRTKSFGERHKPTVADRHPRLKNWLQGARYVLRFGRHKLDAFRAFGQAGVTGAEGHLPHSVINPLATYSPWLADQEFQTAYRIARRQTLVDQYRCYDLWQLVREAGKLAAGDILEVGVWRGGTGCLMGLRAKLSGIPATLWLCDTFQGVVKAGASDRQYLGGEHADTSKDVVAALAQKLNLTNIKILTGTFPEDTGHSITDLTFRMCHIDVDVYESGREILNWVWPRLLPGGIVVFDDYGFLSTGGITRLVNEEREKPDRVMTHNLNGHAVLVKIPI